MSKLGGISVVKKLREYIADNDLKEGSRLPTHERLCEELDVGFRPLREGLSILSQQGIIETRRKGGTFVRKPTVEALMEPISWHLDQDDYTFQDIVRARGAVECMIASEAARSRTSRDLDHMLEAIELSESEAPGTQIDEDADEDFHLAILRSAHNPVLLIFGRLIREQFKQKSDYVRPTPPNRVMRSRQEHRDIYQAIKDRQLDVARDAMYDHILTQLGEIR